ncbi:MAG: circularly permuted type 2 ATP-grasp protein [Bdellovibrionales bacterium]
MKFQLVRRKVLPVFVIASLFIGTIFGTSLAWGKDSGAQAQAYDELYDRQGRLRPQYKELAPYLESVTQSDRNAFRDYSNRRFSLDNAIDDIPKILQEEEYTQITEGVQQRARALLALARDIHSGGTRYQSLIPQKVMAKILGRNLDSPHLGFLQDLDNLTFFYGPDLIRNSNGDFVVLEDNTGFVGGFGDVQMSYDLILERHPEINPDDIGSAPREFFADVVAFAKAQAKRRGGKAIAFFATPYGVKEPVRLKPILESLGIEYVTPRSSTQLKIDSAGVFTQSKAGGKKEKVGYILTFNELAQNDLFHPANLDRFYLLQAQEILAGRLKVGSIQDRRSLKEILNHTHPQTGLPDMERMRDLLDQIVDFQSTKRPLYTSGLTAAILDGRVGSSSVPGLDFLSDKELYTYIPGLISLYLNEKPILKNLRTLQFAARNGALKEELMNRVLADKNSWVLKPVDGRCGDGIWVGPNVTQRQFESSQSVIQNNPSSYLAQEFVQPSTMCGRISDVRPLAFVSEKKIIVGPLWGRNTDARLTKGKMNVASGGALTAVLVRKKRCEDTLDR